MVDNKKYRIISSVVYPDPDPDHYWIRIQEPPGSGCKYRIKWRLFINGRCCPDESHLTNLGTREYVKTMGTSLAELEDWIRDLAYSKRIQLFSVICPATMVDLNNPSDKKKELAKWWGTDPVHLLPAGYSKMAEKLATRIEKERDQEEQEKRYTTKSASSSTSGQRRDGINRSDMSARRHDRQQAAGGAERGSKFSGNTSGLARWSSLRKKK